MKTYWFLLFSFAFPVLILAQDLDSLKSALNAKFESFEYNDAIKITNKLLLENDKLSKTDQIEILRIKAVALYNLTNEDSARIVLIQLLDLDNNYFMDPVKNSPKIVEFFNNIKNFQKKLLNKELDNNHPMVESPKKVSEVPEQEINYPIHNFRGLITRSILFPGWGHLEGGKYTKGWILSSAGLITLTSMIYSIIDCNKKETDYLLDDNRITIQDKYNKYNQSYKIRNISIIAFAAVWIYTQFDLLYISNFEVSKENISSNNILNSESIYLSYKIYF